MDGSATIPFSGDDDIVKLDEGTLGSEVSGDGSGSADDQMATVTDKTEVTTAKDDLNYSVITFSVNSTENDAFSTDSPTKQPINSVEPDTSTVEDSTQEVNVYHRYLSFIAFCLI